eukprot:scaffold179_cov247-Pinguiococcus_pyrenoidosus.AAC.2
MLRGFDCLLFCCFSNVQHRETEADSPIGMLVSIRSLNVEAIAPSPPLRKGARACLPGIPFPVFANTCLSMSLPC